MAELIENILPIDVANAALNALRPDGNEIEYGQYYGFKEGGKVVVPLPRLMAFQASINAAGDSPWYRCKLALVPQNKINYMPWTPTIEKIKDAVEQRTGETWNLAHIIYYRDGDDSMGMHSDSMLDLMPDSRIAVVSFGCTRQMELMKKSRSTEDGPRKMKFDLMHNSVFLLDQKTNTHYLHGITKQAENRTEDRISIVFRYVSTFMTDHGLFYGHELPFASKQDIVQHESRRTMYHYIFSVLVTSFILFVFTAFIPNWIKLFVGIILCYLVIQFSRQIERVIDKYRTRNANEQLRKVCHMKNIEVWNQRDMRDFLK